jgi:hypothetical protein
VFLLQGKLNMPELTQFHRCRGCSLPHRSRLETLSRAVAPLLAFAGHPVAAPSIYGVHLIQFVISGFVGFIEAIFHGYGYRNVPARRAC